MEKPPRIALIHATRAAIDPIETASRNLWPEAEMVSIMEEGLAADRAKSEDLTAAMTNRIVRLARYAEDISADGILFTCSAFGEAIEAAARTSPIPVMKPNEAMFDAAFSYGDSVAMIYTFAPAAVSLEEEFQEEARRRGRNATLTTVFCDEALEAKRAGEDETHDRLIAETVLGVDGADVLMLAQFSMASAAPLARLKTDIPILTSPEAAIREIQHRVSSLRRGA